MNTIAKYITTFAIGLLFLIGYLLSPVFYLFRIIGQIGVDYHTAFASFRATAKALIIKFSEQK